PPGALEPQLVAGPLEQGQERIAVPGGAVAQARSLRDRPCPPRELTAGEREVLVEERPEGRDHPGRSVTPLHADRAGAGQRAVRLGRPVGQSALDDGVASRRIGRSADVPEREYA